jgi:hypothetical protein
MKITQMKIKNIEKWTEDYYPKVEKIKRKKPFKKDLDRPEKGITIKQIKNKL